MIRRASLLLLLIAFATAIVVAQTTQQPGTTPDSSDPTGVSDGSQTGAPGDTDQMRQSGDVDQLDHTQSSQSSSQSTVSNSEESTSSQSTSSSSREQSGQTAIHGTIDKVDSIGNNVTIHTDNNEQETLSMDANTRIKLNGQAAAVADLKPGQRVTVNMDGQKAVSVEVTESSSQIR